MKQLPKTETLVLELDSQWLTIWFNQPEKRNAIDALVIDELRAVLACVRDSRSVRGITIRGKGGIFCAGGDLKAFRAIAAGRTSRDDTLEMSKSGGAMFHEFATMPQVTIAILEGAAMAGGFGIACASDIVICDKLCRFAMTETMIGLSPAQIAPHVIRKLGYNRAKHLMLTAATFNGEQARDIGLADFVEDSPSAMETIERSIRASVLKCAPGAIADTKALILRLGDVVAPDFIQDAAENFANRLISEEGREGLASFTEKRKPNWAMTAQLDSK